MLVMLLAMLIALLAVPCIFAPAAVWNTLLARDDLYEYDGLADANRVAYRNPFSESGPPACMAKLIMLRHKINQTGQRKRKANHQRHSRSSSRTTGLPPRPRTVAWMRFGNKMR